MIRLFLFILCCGNLPAQDAVLARPGVGQALDYLKQHNDAHVERQIRIAQIPAPGFEEQERAKVLRDEFQRLGLQNVEIDPIGNVLGWRPGASPRALVIAAHLDIVFPRGTDVRSSEIVRD
jgi:tripeptide aminopeptidase